MPLIQGNALVRWAQIGFLILLCAPWVMPNSKLYRQLLIAFLWLPALISLGYVSLRPRLPKLDLIAYGLFAGWTLLVWLLQGEGAHIGKAKAVVYVSLSLLGVLLASRSAQFTLERLLRWAVIFGGVGAACSWLYFYGFSGSSLSKRLHAVGIWQTIIMAAHAVGALAVLGLGLFKARRDRRFCGYLLAVVVITGYCAYLISSQTRGVWIALVAGLSVFLIFVPWRARLLVCGLALVTAAAVVFYDPNLLLQRGVSYRPQLWHAGIDLIAQHGLVGLGFAEFQISVTGIERTFKHPHNLFLDTGVRLGLIGLLLFLAVWLLAAWRAWQARSEPLGRASLALWCFATVCLQTDGIGLWFKPNADWLITWLPIALSMVLAQRRALQLQSSKAQDPQVSCA